MTILRGMAKMAKMTPTSPIFTALQFYDTVQIYVGGELFFEQLSSESRDWTVGCSYILKIGFRLMPARTACATIKVAEMQIFRVGEAPLKFFRGGFWALPVGGGGVSTLALT